MKPDLVIRRVIAGLTLAGALIGIVTSVRHAVAGEISGVGWAVTTVFVLLYCLGLCAGIALLRNRPAATAWALPYWLAQVPVLELPLFAYYFGAGISLYLTVDADGAFDVNWFVGTHFGVFVGESGGTALGANIVAAVAVVCLSLLQVGARGDGERPAA